MEQDDILQYAPVNTISGQTSFSPIQGQEDDDDDTLNYAPVNTKTSQEPPKIQTTPPEETILKANPKDPEEATISSIESMYNGRHEEVNALKEKLWKEFLQKEPETDTEIAWQTANKVVDDAIRENSVGAVLGYRYRDYAQEIFTAIPEGAAKAVGETAQFFEETGEAIEDYFNLGRVVFKDNPDSYLPVIEYWNRERVRKAGLKDSIIGATEYVSETVEEAIPDTETVVGGFVEGMAQFATSFALTRRATGIGGIKGGFINGAIADATAFDPYEANISSMYEQFPWMKNAVTEALAIDEDDAAFKNRLRNAGEGFIIGGALEGAAKAYRYIRGHNKAKAELALEGEVKEETLQEMDNAVSDLESWEESLRKEAEEFKAGKSKSSQVESSKPDEEMVKKERVAWRKKYDINRAKANTEIEAQEQKERASARARISQEVSAQLILEFEEGLKESGMQTTKISRMVDGKLEIDPELARKVSKEKLEQVSSAKKRTIQEVVLGRGEDSIDISDAVNLSMSEGEMFSAVLKPEKFDAIVAVAADLRDKEQALGMGIWDDNNKVIDNLFNLTVQNELIGGQELLDTLAKYGLSFEDYVMTVVGSASEAGRALNQLSQIKRARPFTQREAYKQKKLLESQDRIRDTMMRIENIRRGMMVSQLATAQRNLLSGVIRAPMEGIGKIMDNALMEFENGGVSAFGKSFIPYTGKAWQGSFRHMRLMFTNPRAAKEYTQLIMNQPELIDNLDRFYNQMADLQKKMGRGNAKSTAGKVVDFAISRGEDVSAILNTPNRWQEFMLRNGMFLADVERLVKRDWGTDLIEAINEGKIRDIMTDASSVKPEGARSFIDIADEAMYNALDLTYANEPDFKLFRQLNTFIVRNGLTTVLPFPRFMFKSMELLAQYGAGSLIPVTRFVGKAFQSDNNIRQLIAESNGIKAEQVTDEMIKRERRAFTRKERDMIGKNLQGAMLIGAAYLYRTSENAPEDYTKLNADDGYVIDSTPLFPLRPVLLIGELLKQSNKGRNTFDNWIENNTNELVEVLTGTNFRTGPSGYILNDIVSNVFAGNPINETTVKNAGAALGNYFSTFLVPYAQVLDAARVTGFMNNEYLDNAEEPTLNRKATFIDNFERPFRQRYSFEQDLPSREFVLSETSERQRVAWKLFGGLNFYQADPEYAAYLKGKGYNEFKISAYSKSPTQKRVMNRHLREWLKTYVPKLQNKEEQLRNRWEFMDEKEKGGRTFDDYFDAVVMRKFEEDLIEKKNKFRKISMAELEDETKVYLGFNKLPKKVRRRAQVLWETQNGPADLNDIDTVREITLYGNQIR